MTDVLYVEDDPNDADIFSRLMRKLDRSISFTIIDNGFEALDYLTSQGKYLDQTRPMPKLVLMDLNMEGISGFEVIQQARQTESARFLPIVAFSTSDSPTDVRAAYEAGINAYIVKPGGYQATASLLSRLYDFWLDNNLCLDSR
ncbi:response regulator [Spirosoma sp. KUDC1026]|uniref:response regulator n=1 Tax=Spirosoma sp. KUDC1026 TaxID=2745947 RepID=UPI00159BCE2C|nr:response regulator [Spirosoma sp. KUDC1026]QKZ14009.1 response regulator [Spirosoma sp. KUDC1026]